MKALKVALVLLGVLSLSFQVSLRRADAEFCRGVYTSCAGLCLATWAEFDSGVLECFLDQGISVDCRYEGNTPLITSVMWAPNPKVVRLLLDYGANVNLRNDKGETALAVAERMRASQMKSNVWPALDQVILVLKEAGGTK